MAQGIAFAVAAGFMLVGIAAVAYYFSVRVLFPKNAGKYAVVLIADSDSKNMAQLIYGAYLRLDLLGDSSCSRVVAVDFGMSESERMSCESLCKECGGVSLCTPKELADILHREE